LTVSLRQADYKLTAPRLAVLQVIETAGEHLSHAETLERALSERLGFQIRSHMLEFYGLCKECCG